MPKHEDNDPVLVGFASSRNISMRSHRPEELGYTWGEWREMSQEERREAMSQYVHELVEAWVEDDEEGGTW